ncbi:hypothetical protein E3N88_03011 [Mikania micrantha]|uniref:Uncharacterized protein n=1 Tax=Mikania micrantha TaxID=192012 RepID=A0A5N6Q5E2_9ASTR|nr:hypothetical protein E3N88_03011 [Mikania micrantha]
MNATRPTTDGIEPPYTTDSGRPQGGDTYIFAIGFFCIVVLLISLTYTSYICKRSRPPPPPPSITFRTTAHDDADSHRLVRHVVKGSSYLSDVPEVAGAGRYNKFSRVYRLMNKFKV